MPLNHLGQDFLSAVDARIAQRALLTATEKGAANVRKHIGNLSQWQPVEKLELTPIIWNFGTLKPASKLLVFPRSAGNFTFP